VRLRVIAVLCAIVAGVSKPAHSQLIPIELRSYVAVNPLGIPFDIASAEFETALASGVTVGGLASYTALQDDRYRTFDGKLRYYPGEVVLRGFSLGASLGYTHFSTTETLGGVETNPTANYATLGLLVDYNFMLGARHRFILGTGVGAKRVFADTRTRDPVHLDKAYGTARFVIGIAF